MESPSDNSPKTVPVLLPIPVETAFDYAVPEGMSFGAGDYVRVPFGKRELVGVVWDSALAGERATFDTARLKPVAARLNVPPMPEALRTFIVWVARYTLQPVGSILKLSLTVDSAQEARRAIQYIWSTPLPPGIRMTPARLRVQEVMQDGKARTAAALTRAASCTPSVLTGLVKEGALTAKEVEVESDIPLPDPGCQGPVLSGAQQAAAEALVQRIAEGTGSEDPGVTLLEGVTGSGKTEVFAAAMRAVLAAGKQVLVLMPEIALSVQMIARFSALFGAPPVCWHSDIGSGTRRQVWHAVASGKARVVLGARSALFLPFASLGLIVVDEEHDGAYKQEEGTAYHARDLAVVRGRMEGAPVILSSATPSVETVVNVQEGRYARVSLPERHGGAVLPEVRIVDLLKAPPPRGRWLAPESVEAVRQALARGEQALLFLNRRGYAPLTLCRACGHRLMCPHCTAWMVEHRSGPKGGALHCHHCGHREKHPALCPHCGAEDSFVPCGPGVERVAEESKALFPHARTLVMTSDTQGGWKEVQIALSDVAAGRYDILVGTQLVAKGHHFPALTQVVVVDADVGLEGGDLRAAEHTFQILQQVGGRAGRAERAGSVILQTHCAGNFIFRALVENDREGFLAHEIALRARHQWPPFARLAALILSGSDLGNVEKAAQEIRAKSPQLETLSVFGPAPAPLARLKDSHRVRLLVRAARGTKLQPILAAWLASVVLPKGVQLKIIIDPFTFL